METPPEALEGLGLAAWRLDDAAVTFDARERAYRLYRQDGDREGDITGGYRRLDDAIQQRLGTSGVQDIFALGDADELHRLLTDAGFQQVEIEPVSMTARFPNPDAFLAGEIDVDTAAIPSMQHLDAQARQAITAAIGEDMEAPLLEVTEGDPFLSQLWYIPS